MTRRLLWFLGVAMLAGCSQSPVFKPHVELKSEIDRIFAQSLAQCDQLNPGCRKCVENQFHTNYQAYILRPAWAAASGPPGVPGEGYCQVAGAPKP